MDYRTLKKNLTQQADRHGVEGVMLKVTLPPAASAATIAEITRAAREDHAMCVRHWGLRPGDKMDTNVGQRTMTGNVAEQIADQSGDHISVTINWEE